MMKAWIYCVVKEKNSCKELGLLRQKCIEFARERRMAVAGITSLNVASGQYALSSTLDEAVNHKVAVLIIGNKELLPVYKRCLITDICKKHGITIIPYAEKGDIFIC